MRVPGLAVGGGAVVGSGDAVAAGTAVCDGTTGGVARFASATTNSTTAAMKAMSCQRKPRSIILLGSGCGPGYCRTSTATMEIARNSADMTIVS